MRITAQQYSVLSSASKDNPIYAENPSMMHVQMPDQSRPQPLRTVLSLVRKGLLRSDGKGGYLITDLGFRMIHGPYV